MGVFASLPASANGPVAAVRELLKRLLAEGQAKAVLVMMETRDGLGVQPALVTRGERLETANPFLPVMPVHLARMASLLTERGVGEGQRPERVAVVLRPCELRALVELAKLKQADLGQLLTIGVDCVGTYEGADWKRWASSEPQALALYLDATQRGSLDSPGPAYRHACRICQTPSSWNPDLGIHWLGLQGAVMAEAEKPDLLESLRLTSDADPTAHQQVVEQVLHTRLEARQARLDEVAAQMQQTGSGQPGLVVAFEACQRCHNCTVACPICYCKECLFRTDNMRHEPRHYLTGSERKGVVRLPGDTVAFQLTRLTHVSTSCVGCGMCTSACPADLPVDALFQTVARRTQALFDYVPGRSLEDPLPPATYERTEFVGLGEVER